MLITLTDLLTRYYGIDWVLFLLIVLHLWMLGNRCRFAFLIGATACCFGFTLGILIGSLASILMNIVFFAMHIRAFVKWSRGMQLTGPRLAEGTWPEMD